MNKTIAKFVSSLIYVLLGLALLLKPLLVEDLLCFCDEGKFACPERGFPAFWQSISLEQTQYA